MVEFLIPALSSEKVSDGEVTVKLKRGERLTLRQGIVLIS